jgi:hypothetical protein
MNSRATRSQEDLTGTKEADLYSTPPDTKRRVNTKKSIRKTPSESESDVEGESPLGRFTTDQTPKPTETFSTADNTANEMDHPREQSVYPDELDRQRQHEIQLRQLEMQHELEMAKLQLQMAQANAANSNLNPAAIQITQRENKVADFKKEVVSKNLKTSFKLEGSNNYEAWRDEALTQALNIKAKHILNNKETICPENITDNDERGIWEVKNETIFDLLLAGTKPAIRQTIKARIDEDKKNAAELWIALDTEYRIHAADTRMELVRKFATASIDANNVQIYISQFRDTCGKLEHMGFQIPKWLQNDRFIDGLDNHQSGFVRTKRDEIRDPKNKGNITELNLDELMDQLIARAIDHKDKSKPPAKALKADDKDELKSDSTTSTSGQESTPQQLSARNSKPNRENNQQDRKNCGYCGGSYHDEPHCKYKHYTRQSEEWQTKYQSVIQYLKRQHEGKSTSSSTSSDSIPSTSSISTNPDVGFSAIASSTPSFSIFPAHSNVGLSAIALSTTSNNDSNWYLDSGASYHMTPFRDKFTTFRSIKESSTAGGITGHEITPQGVGTIQQHIDNQVLEIQNVRYMPNIVANLISYRQLEKQGFKIKPIPMQDGTSLFEITDPQGQTFRAIPSASNVYPISGVTDSAAAKAKRIPSKQKALTPYRAWHSKPHATPKDTILEPISRIVGATTISKKDEMTNPPSRSGIPKTRRRRRKKLPMVDPAVLLARELTNSIKSKPPTSFPSVKQNRARIAPVMGGKDHKEKID